MPEGEPVMYPWSQQGRLIDHELAGADEISHGQTDCRDTTANDDQVVPDVDARAPPATWLLKTQAGERGCGSFED